MADQSLKQLLDSYEGKSEAPAPSALPTQLPDIASLPSELRPRLAQDPARQLEEFRVRTVAKNMGVDPHIAAAIAHQESGFNPAAISPTGVRGTMQVTRPTAQDLGYNRDDPDQNIQAGVALLKRGFDKYPNDPSKALSIYPDPRDAPKYIPSVLSKADKSRSLASADLSLKEMLDSFEGLKPQPQPAPATQPEQALAQPASQPEQSWMSKALATASGALSGYGAPNAFLPQDFAVNQINKMLGLPEKPLRMTVSANDIMSDIAANPIAQSANEGLRGLLGDNRSFQDTAASASGQVQQANADNPGYNTAGAIGSSFIPGNPASAIGSALLGPIFGAAGKGLKSIGKGVANILAKQPLSSKVGETIASKLPRLTKGGIEKAANKAINQGKNEIDTIIKANPNFTLGLRKIAQDPDLMNMAVKYEQAGETAVAKKMLNKLADFETKVLGAKDADQLRSTLWELSKFTSKGKVGSGVMSQFNKALGEKVRTHLIENLGPGYEQALAKQSSNIPVAKAMRAAKDSGANWLITALRGGAAYATNGVSEIPFHAATATPVASAAYQAGRGLEAVSPELGAILAALGLAKKQ